MPRKLFLAVCAALLAIAGLFAILIVAFTGAHRRERTRDAVQCVAGVVSELLRKNRAPSPHDIDAAVRVLHDGSITAVELDAAGKPVDVYGTPFRVRWIQDGVMQTVTATSAGPDRRFDTDDDISDTQVSEMTRPATK